MAPRRDCLARREDPIPRPCPPQGGNLKTQNRQLSAGGWETGRRGGLMRNGRSRVPGDNPESRAGPGYRVNPRARRPGPGWRTPTRSRIGPGPAGDPPRGAPRGLAERARAHTHAPHTRIPARASPAGRPRAVDALGQSPLPSPPLAPPSPTPVPGAAARKTLHSPEFLHVCGRGLRETKREGQQAGGVRSAAAPGGAGHRGHRRARRRVTPARLGCWKVRPARPQPTLTGRSPWDSVGARGLGRVTGEPARAAAHRVTPPGERKGLARGLGTALTGAIPVSPA